MSPILLLCGIPSAVQAEIQLKCKDAVPGASILFLNTLKEASDYLNMASPFGDRDYPAPHFMILHVIGSQYDTEALRRLKLVREFSRIPVVLLAEDVMRPELKEAFQWLFAGIIEVPSNSDDKINLIVEMASYWAGIAKLPLV